jgi:hypothetical protein
MKQPIEKVFKRKGAIALSVNLCTYYDPFSSIFQAIRSWQTHNRHMCKAGVRINPAAADLPQLPQLLGPGTKNAVAGAFNPGRLRGYFFGGAAAAHQA